MTQNASQSGYLSRSWHLLTQDRGWIKPILLLALAMFVPVAGPLAVMGYAFEWARLIAWGADGAPKQTGVKVGELIKAGWRAFIPALVWGLVLATICSVLLGFLGLFLWGTAYEVVEVLVAVAAGFVELIIAVASLRAVIYERIGAGMGIGHVFKMVGRDPEGLVRVWLIPLIGGVALGLIAFVLMMVMVMACVPALTQIAFGTMGMGGYPMGQYVEPASIQALIWSILSTVLPLVVVFGYILSVMGLIVEMTCMGALGLWTRQFDVAAWGDPSDPLPDETPALPNPSPSAAMGTEGPSRPIQEDPGPSDAAPVVPVVPAAPTANDEVREPPVTPDDDPSPTPEAPTPKVVTITTPDDEDEGDDDGGDGQSPWDDVVEIPLTTPRDDDED